MPKAQTVVRRLLPVMPAVLPSMWAQYFLVVDAGRTVKPLGPAGVLADMDLTFDRASSLTLRVLDPDLKLWKDEALTGPVTLLLGSDPDQRYVREWLYWRERGVGTIGREGANTKITFWDAGSGALKTDTSPLARSASSMNLEGWVRYLAGRVKSVYPLDVVVPRPNSTPPRETGDAATTTSGWSSETRAKVTVNGAAADTEQLKNLDIVLARAVKEEANALATRAAMCAGTGESGFKAIMNQSGSPYGGVFQGNVRDGTWQLTDTDGMAKSFLRGGKGFQGGGAIALAKQHPDWAPGRIALTVEGSVSNFPSLEAGVRHYNRHDREGKDNMQLWSGVSIDQWSTVTGAGGSSDDPASDERPTEWRRGQPDKPESSLKALSRGAEGLGQRSFVSANRLVVGRDQDLILAAPHMSFALDDPLVLEWPDIQHDGNHSLGTFNLSVNASAWVAPPGAVVEIVDSGQIERTWLVQSVSYSGGSLKASVALQQPTTKIPAGNGKKEEDEPTGTVREKIVAAAKASLTTKTGHNYYSQAGQLTDDPIAKPPKRSDCSQWLRACYIKAGAGDPGTSTFSMVQRCKRTSDPKPGDLLMDPAGQRHVEMFVGGGRTIGHGSPPIDYGDVAYWRRQGFVFFALPTLVAADNRTTSGSRVPERTSTEQNAIDRANNGG